jgi:hypothetical protein
MYIRCITMCVVLSKKQVHASPDWYKWTQQHARQWHTADNAVTVRVVCQPMAHMCIHVMCCSIILCQMLCPISKQIPVGDDKKTDVCHACRKGG